MDWQEYLWVASLVLHAVAFFLIYRLSMAININHSIMKQTTSHLASLVKIEPGVYSVEHDCDYKCAAGPWVDFGNSTPNDGDIVVIRCNSAPDLSVIFYWQLDYEWFKENVVRWAKINV